MALFEQSAAHWQSQPDAPQAALKRGLALFYLGRAQYFIADNAKYRQPDWARAVTPLQECLRVFDQAGRPDLVAQGITQLERTLRRLARWDDLHELAQRSLALHQTYGPPSKLAQDYGHLAAVALQQHRWPAAAAYARQALDTLPPRPSSWRILFLKTLANAEYAAAEVAAATEHLQAARALGVMEHPKLYSDVLALLQQCLRDQRQYLEAFTIKRQRLAIEKQYGLRAFIGAGRLRAQRTEQQATVRSEPQTLEDIAPEITASGRSRDLNQLLNRIAGKTHKLLVLHGTSGVGKSSLVNGGLLPALQGRALDNRDNLPVLIRQYTDWPQELATRLDQALALLPAPRLRPQSLPSPATDPTPRPPATSLRANSSLATRHSSLLTTLRRCEAATLRPVFIFDQFEEFFFAHSDPLARRDFFQFIADCLELQPSALKIVLSLRQDYLHYLLEAKQLVRLNQLAEGSMARSQLEDILGKQVLYEIGNFAPADAKAIIQQLASGSRIFLEPALIDALVADLAGPLQEVRPIEMQIVGAQLQTEGIQTLDQYRHLGEQPKETLVQRYLEDVVIDCGEENRQLAELVLFLLTDERGTRPLKTKPELLRDLGALGIPITPSPLSPPGRLRQHPITPSPPHPITPPPATNAQDDNLDLVLRILCGSGIGIHLPDSPDDRYQLVHDYLAGVIREHQAPRLEALMAELEEEKRRRLEAESETLVLTEANRKARRRLFWSSGLLAASLVAALLAGTFAGTATNKANRAEQELIAKEQSAQDAEIREREARAELEQAEAEAQQAARDLTRLETQAKISEQEIEAARIQFAQLEQKAATTQRKNQEIQEDLNRATSAIQEIESERERLIQEQEALIKRERQIRNDLNISQEELESIQNELSSSRFQLEEIENDLVANISEVLKLTREQTSHEVTPAILYVNFAPKKDFPQGDEDYSLTLWLITYDGQSIKENIDSVTQEKVLLAIDNIQRGYRRRDLKVLEDLYEWMIDPIEGNLRDLNINNIVFLMDKSIRGRIPIAALYDGEKFFVQKYSFGLMPGLTLSDARYVDLRQSGLLLIGIDAFDEYPELALGPIPYVNLEIDRLSEIWVDKTVLRDQDANYPNVLSVRRRKNHQIVHIATHGGSLANRDNLPQLVLWDRILTPQDISPQDWYSPPVDLLVLSTGELGLERGEYKFGIAGAFLNAGVKSVIADLFYSSDSLYPELMARFYQNLQVAPIRAEALRRAQLFLLREFLNEKVEYEREYNKGSFTIEESLTVEESDIRNIEAWGAGITIIGNPW
ncbi:Tetratricopeptide repeat domain protein [Halomicronema hongdechloris C2206]|uniref:Tetratricopeptide repeat domain protein n=1 Tax=Halomicronema hongdechloris C2206 TaxID=1641165 RepID=A0A1Z3HU79_9CYAN|nr:CHAT domain-containing protein [Halomicronema hongdechloris]ASC73871.1 Tetratricopeptide repeat domain protein [Halomicronema hongdechloris C2206]